MKKTRKLRTCVGCRERALPDKLLRWVLGPGDQPFVDLYRRAGGRGAWTHAEARCLERAHAGFQKSFKRRLENGSAELYLRLGAAAEEAFAIELAHCAKERQLALGTAASESALSESSTHLLVTATNAGAAIRRPQVQAAIVRGKAISWGTVEALGQLTGHPDPELAVVLDENRSLALSRLHGIGQLCRKAVSQHDSSKEV